MLGDTGNLLRMPVTDRTVLSMTPEAATAIIGIRAEEPDAADLALAVGITGARNLEFTYELTFIPIVDATPGDVLQHFGELAVVVRADSVTRLDGATIKISDAGLSIDNPNSSSPKIPTGSASREGPLADQVRNLLDTRINPAIASHGGVAELVAVEGDTVYLRLGGGCQGCGMAQVTLGQGIEVAIKEAFPEILNIVDVTDHEAGANPYFESAKK